jgi:hypothetical protein
MKVSKFGLFLLCLYIFVFSGKVTLQQGVNGYDGCIDATTCATSSDVKYESHHQLSLDNFRNG